MVDANDSNSKTINFEHALTLTGNRSDSMQ